MKKSWRSTICWWIWDETILDKISKLGSVKVEKYMTMERYSCVMHLGSTVTGSIKEGKDAVDAVDAILTCRNPFRGTEVPCLPDHSGTGAEQERHLRRCHRICGFHRKSGCVHCHPAGYIRKKMKSVSGREPESWQTAYRKKNIEECQNKARAVVRRHRARQRRD